ncbi:MAG: DUF2177 family protein [Deltaproteobacteria bacterium]|jgi:uncharacterized membrane protein|nr:DUF2177 family protein [Deltaproteobacteria bacterium]
MMHGIKVYFATLPVFLALDFFWLGFLMAKFYKTELGPLSRGGSGSYETVWWAAAVVYICIPLGIVLFVVPRLAGSAVFPWAPIWGGLYGFVLYAVYDMTNYALVDKWPLRMSVVDICWGVFICGSVSVAAAYFDRLFQ